MAGPAASKGVWLRAAFGAGRAHQVLSIFRKFVEETGYGAARHQQTNRRQASQPAPAIPDVAKAIEKFYSDCRRGLWDSNPEGKAREEKRLHGLAHGASR
jgi:hypothetical protein